MACSVNGESSKRLMPPTYLLIFLVLAVMPAVASTLVHVSVPLMPAAGLLALVAGIALNLASHSALTKSSTPISPLASPTSFVDTGVFAYSRNPMYLGMVLIVASAALLTSSALGLLAAFGFALVLDRAFIPTEERNLEAAFGEGYVSYRRRVRRWL